MGGKGKRQILLSKSVEELFVSTENKKEAPILTRFTYSIRSVVDAAFLCLKFQYAPRVAVHIFRTKRSEQK